MFRIDRLLLLAVTAAALSAGCNHAKSPGTVAKDVNSAAQRADERAGKAEEQAQHEVAVQEQKLAKADAEGARDVALAKCEALQGDQQQACKDEAKASYDEAVARAKSERAEDDPKR